MFSPLAQPYRAPESVASFLQEQQEPLTSALRSDQPIPEYIPENRMEFKSMIDTINDYDKTPDSESDHRSDRRSSSPPAPDLEPSRELYMRRKKELEDKLAVLEGRTASLQDENTEIATKLGLVQFQIESTENQNAAMSRALSERDATIKKQELEMKKKELEMKSKTTGIQDLDAKLKSKDAEIKAQNAQLVRKEVEIAKHVAEIKKKHRQLGARNALINKTNAGSKFHHHAVPKGPKLTHAR